MRVSVTLLMVLLPPPLLSVLVRVRWVMVLIVLPPPVGHPMVAAVKVVLVPLPLEQILLPLCLDTDRYLYVKESGE
jgi:hypothetical protein